MIVALSLSLLTIIILILLVSEEPMVALESFFIGPLTTTRRLGNIFSGSIPLIFSGLAVVIMFKVGLFNLSLEGSIFIGIVVAAVTALTLNIEGPLLLVISLLFASLAGGITTSIPGILKVKTNTNELVTSLMLNFVMLNIGLYLVSGFFDPTLQARYSYKLPESVLLSNLIPGTNIHTGFIIAIIAVILAAILLNKTSFGTKFDLVGSNKTMAKFSGLKGGKIIILSQFIGGLFAGLGGAIQLFGLYERFQYTDLTGFGWDGILIAIIARNNPVYVIFSALFFSYLKVGADVMSIRSDVPFEMIEMIQAIILVFISVKSLLSRYEKKLLVKKLENNELEVE